MVEQLSESGVHFEQPRCPYCHDGIPAGTPQLACNTCRAWHHQECWGEAGKRCAACGSDATGFLSADETPSGVQGRGHDRAREFRFLCPHCDAAMWAPKDAAGRQGTCPTCKQETRIPELAAAKETQKTPMSWQGELTGGLLLFVFLALIVGAVGWGLGLFGELMSDMPGAASRWFRRGFTVPYLLGYLIAVGVSTSAPKAPKGWIWLLGLLSLVPFGVAWWHETSLWIQAALLVPWPLIAYGNTHTPPPDPPPPPPPGKAPWQGE